MHSLKQPTQYLITALFSLLMITTATEAYVLTITQSSRDGSHLNGVFSVLYKGNLLTEQKSKSMAHINLEKAKEIAITKLNKHIKKAGFEPKTDNTFVRLLSIGNWYETKSIYPQERIRSCPKCGFFDRMSRPDKIVEFTADLHTLE